MHFILWNVLAHPKFSWLGGEKKIGCEGCSALTFSVLFLFVNFWRKIFVQDMFIGFLFIHSFIYLFFCQLSLKKILSTCISSFLLLIKDFLFFFLFYFFFPLPISKAVLAHNHFLHHKKNVKAIWDEQQVFLFIFTHEKWNKQKKKNKHSFTNGKKNPQMGCKLLFTIILFSGPFTSTVTQAC